MSSLPFSNVDMKDGLQTTTQSRTGSYKSLSQNQQSYFHLKPPLPRKTQTDLSGNHRDMLDQYQMDEDTARHHRQTRGPSRGPPNGYGLYNMHSNKETEDEEPRIIKDPGLVYDGEHFMKFLERFERTALAYQASGYNKALQILWITNRNSFKSHLSQYMKYSSTPTLEKPMDVADMVMDVADTVMDIADTVMDVADTVFGLMANTKDFEKRKMDLEDMKMNLNEDLLMKDIGYIKTVPGATRDDNQCSTKPTIYWIHNVNKLKEKIFNKHLFKPHSSLFKYVQIFCVPQKLKLKETEQGTDEEDLISISVPITITKAAAINAPVHPIPAVLPIIPEECFPNLLPPVPPDTTQPPEYSNDILGKETAITTFSSDKSINNQWRCQLNKIPPQIKPEGIGQLYSKVGFQRILVGVG
ncbi:hypothetical protein PSTG_16615 [Puccinia striiformis f. sp. tritici PST-78]|uniref:Uncharacterized protein n=1 Tax=Puccinia striiformis f. sp. tritici PST-78 TaxID=1165861 RepID=A0A0L0US73_9BASI|nr:hypothetical protein PSTG_16615 [Puccinia striiformis f. sp. tritici PST-78]